MKKNLKLNTLKIINLIMIFSLFAGCKREEFNWGVKVGEITYSGNVIFLTSNELALLKDANPSRLVFENMSGTLEKVTNMSILVIGVSDKTPYGLLRKVTSIQRNGSEVIIYSSQATLAEAVKEGTIRFHQKLLEKDFELKSKIEGVNVTGPVKSFDGLAITLKGLEIFNNGSQKALLDGAIGISPEIDITITIKSNRVTEAAFSTTLSKIDELTISSDGKIDGKNEITAAEFIHIPVVTDSMVMVPEVTIKCGLDGTTAGKVVSGVRQDRVITKGMKLSGSTWSEDPLTNNVRFDFIDPQVTDNADLKVASGPELKILLFGVPLQILKADGIQQLEAQKAGSLSWKLLIGNNGYDTAGAEILGLSADHSVNLTVQSLEIGSSGTN